MARKNYQEIRPPDAITSIATRNLELTQRAGKHQRNMDMTNVKKYVSDNTEAGGVLTVRGKVAGDEQEKGVGRIDQDRNGKKGSKEKTNIGSEQVQCRVETYVNGHEDRRGRDKEQCTVVCGVEETPRNVRVKGCDERDVRLQCNHCHREVELSEWNDRHLTI